MRFRIIIVEPRYQINLGYMARVSKNFGVRELYLVNPRVKIGRRAIMFSKHASNLLRNARICRSIASATRGCDIIVGTTGLRSKASVNFKKIYLMDEAVGRLSRIKGNKTTAILIGRDGTGLRREELGKCDMVAYIGTDPGYPVLNISHALGIMLYLLTASGFRSVYAAPAATSTEKRELGYLMKSFSALIKNKRIRDKKAVNNTFRRLMNISQPNLQEIHALITAFK